MYFFWGANTFIHKPDKIFLFTFQGKQLVITEPHHKTTMKYFFGFIYYNLALQVKPYNGSMQIKVATELFFNI